MSLLAQAPRRNSDVAATRRRRTGPLVLLLPFLFFLLAVVYMLQRPERGPPALPPLSDDPEASVAALRGELAAARGTWLEATLVPLRVDPRRRAFEAQALARELELEPGEPWRLSVRWSSPGAGEPAAGGPPGRARGAGLAPREAPAGDDLPGIALGAVQVLDQQGLALRSLPAVPAGSGALDPLRTLCAPPSGALRPGQSADWILWGRSPGEAPRLSGLVPAEDAQFLAATGLSGEFLLRATYLRRGDLEQPLARLEREVDEAGRKSRARPSSDEPRADDDER